MHSAAPEAWYVCVWLPSFENFCNNPTWWHKRVIGVSDSGLMTSAEHSFFTPCIDRSRQDWIRLATIHDLVIIWSLWMMMVWTTASTVLCLQFYSADVQWEYMDTTAEKFKSVSESKWLWLCFEHTISLSSLATSMMIPGVTWENMVRLFQFSQNCPIYHSFAVVYAT